jgi:hypothetical protein
VSVRIAVPIVAVVALVIGVAGFVAFDGGTKVRALVKRTSVQHYPTSWAQSPPPASVTIRVDPNVALRPISPLIYGLAHAKPEEVASTGATLNRWGGNPNTRYNWQVGNAWNAARDWEFRNYGADQPGSGGPSAVADQFIADNRREQLTSVMTVPSMGWVAKSGSKDLASTGVPAEGGPPLPDSPVGAIAGYDPSVNRSITSVPSAPRKIGPGARGVVYQDQWIAHLVQQFGTAAKGGVPFYAIDNEPDLWSYTHVDVHPAQMSYDEMVSNFVDYAEAIKDVDPSAQILGPTLSGWTSIYYSALDKGNDAYRTHADRRAHGDVPFLPWWLGQIAEHDREAGRRTLDVVDVHFYPQATGVFSGATDESTSRIRVRSTRALWDPSYVDESWIAEPVRLIPRLREWIDQNYPDTRIAIGEWNWGADTTMNGAVAIADVLGIFGREGVDIAAYWTSPPANSPGARAFAMYTNYDGKGGRFGDLSVKATTNSPDDVQSFASVDSSTGTVLIMLINQRPDATLSTNVELTGQYGSVSAYRLSRQAADRIQRLPPVASLSNLALPPESITLLRAEPA